MLGGGPGPGGSHIFIFDIIPKVIFFLQRQSSQSKQI